MSTNDDFIAPSELEWDDEVDMICAGAGPGVLAHAVFCSDLDMTVELADTPVEVPPADPDTAAYLESMTEDLGPLAPTAGDLELSLLRAQPVILETGRRARVEPFFGAHLRAWSARCVASPLGVLHSHVPGEMDPMRTESGELIRVALLGEYRPQADRPGPELTDWLREQAYDRRILGQGETTLERLIFEFGRVAGAALSTSAGTRLVRATAGVALSTAAMPDEAQWPVQAELRGAATQAVLVSRTASRFARVELLTGF
ncbi:hypothetical protein ACXDF8_15240 [Mycolicibacterium sp. CBM1]